VTIVGARAGLEHVRGYLAVVARERGGCIMKNMIGIGILTKVLVVTAYDLALVVAELTREEDASLELRVATLAGSMTFWFQSRPGVWLTNADHLAKVTSGHLVISRWWIILHVEPWGQLRLTRWWTVQSRMAGLALLMEGIMLVTV